MSKHKRSRRYVDGEVQGALIVRCLCHWALFLVIAFALIFIMHALTGDPDLTWSAHLSAMWGRYGMFVVVMAALLPAFVLDLVKLTHRFVGPMVRFRRAMSQLGTGDTHPPLRFRDGDVWNDLASNFNAVVHRIEKLEAQLASSKSEHLTAQRHRDAEPATAALAGEGR